MWTDKQRGIPNNVAAAAAAAAGADAAAAVAVIGFEAF
jgi:hypothetical protein